MLATLECSTMGQSTLPRSSSIALSTQTPSSTPASLEYSAGPLETLRLELGTTCSSDFGQHFLQLNTQMREIYVVLHAPFSGYLNTKPAKPWRSLILIELMCLTGRHQAARTPAVPSMLPQSCTHACFSVLQKGSSGHRKL